MNDTIVPGIRRLKTRSGFRYVLPDGQPVRDAAHLKRIRELVVPPAWADVWICPFANGHLQATGRDTRGRKQYIYHQDWLRVRDETKFDRMAQFGRALPGIRARVEKDLALPGLPREKVLAALVRLLDVTLARVGNQEYARTNGTYGLTTLRPEHAEVVGAWLRLSFPGKRAVQHIIDIHDRRLANIIRKMQDLPGQDLFTYLDDSNQARDVGSADVNAYLREISGQDFTAKDFRTFGATVLAVEVLRAIGPFESATQAKRNVLAAVRSVAARLRNTVAVCRRSYIHPRVIECYVEGVLVDGAGSIARANEAVTFEGPTPEEEAVLRFLEARLEEKTPAAWRAAA